MRHLTRIVPMLMTLALASPAMAAGGGTVLLAPPGDSAVSQYTEVVPNDQGASPPRAGAGPSGSLGPGATRRLGGVGSDGRLLASVVASTGPPAISGAGTPGHAGGSSRSPGAGGVAGTRASDRRGELSPSDSASPGSLLLSSAIGAGSGGLGIGLGAIAVAAGLAGLARAIRRRDRQQ